MDAAADALFARRGWWRLGRGKRARHFLSNRSGEQGGGTQSGLPEDLTAGVKGHDLRGKLGEGIG